MTDIQNIYHSLGISAVNECGKNLRYKRGKRYDRVRFCPNFRYIKGRIFRHVYEGIQSEIVNTIKF